MQVKHVLTGGILLVTLSAAGADEPKVLLEESFQSDLSKDWFWGLGTWQAKEGVLRGFESGPRRHGPVKMRKLTLADAVIACDFRLVGKATFAGIIVNGSQDRGHLFHLVMGRDVLRIIAHPTKGESIELVKQPHQLRVDAWHQATMTIQGETLSAVVDDQKLQVKHACIAESKQTFGLGGDSGGPQGEAAGVLEFRRLKITTR